MSQNNDLLQKSEQFQQQQSISSQTFRRYETTRNITLPQEYNKMLQSILELQHIRVQKNP